MTSLRSRGRDNARTPVQWDDSAHAGFTTGEPWLPVTDDLARYSVEAQEGDPRSMLALHRALLALRRMEPALHAGGWAAVDAPDGVVAYDRAAAGVPGNRFRVLLNLRSQAVRVPLDEAWSVALSTAMDVAPGTSAAGVVDLRADEGLVLRGG
jgi:alpha-glucosidase